MMRKFYLPVLLSLLFGCSKRDLQIIRNYEKKNRCTVVSVNADKQNTDDFFLVKTFDSDGLLSHIKTQIGDIYGAAFLFDYDVTYGKDKAFFKGSTRAYWWVADNLPEDPDAEPDPNAPTHPEEIAEFRDLRDFVVLLDPKTHYPVEVKYTKSGETALKLKYDNRGFLSKVDGYFVKTDNRGNILSILTAPLVEEEPYYGPQQLGIRYKYSDKAVSKGLSQFYETPTIFISQKFSLLELLNWGPFQPDRERIRVSLQHNYADEYLPSPLMEADYTNHQYDQRGKLVKYDFEGSIRRDLPHTPSAIRQSIRTINWQCTEHQAKF